MAYEYPKLRGRIVEKFGSQEEFAKAIGRSTVYVSKKLNGRSAFSKASIELWAKALEIPHLEIGLYFFD